MPLFLEKNKSQLSTSEANKSRLCTKQRGIVERVFGRLQSHFKYYANRSQNKSLKTDFRDLLNVCSVLNTYFLPIISDSGYEEEISNRLKSLLHKPTHLSDFVIQQKLNSKRVNFRDMDSSLDIEFPFLEQQDLYLLALGSYQLKLAPSYYAQHSGNAENIIQIYRDQDILKSVLEHSIICEEPYLLRGRIHSRHSNKTKYFLNILHDLSKTGVHMIIGYCCQCKSGLRTVGCCAHIMTTFWFFCNAR